MGEVRLFLFQSAGMEVFMETKTTNPPKAKHKIYDSVFTNLFRIPEYTLQLYQALHPEDTETTVEQLEIVTLENILLNQSYNDLGFVAGKNLLILVEAQSVRSENILVRVLLYIAQSIHRYIINTEQNVYGKTKVSIPEPEFYVIDTDDAKKNRPSELILSKEFFGGKETGVDVRVKMIYDGEPNDIIHQYVTFTKNYKMQRRKYGKTREAVLETIRICKDQDVLKDYLESRKEEVVDIMMNLYDEEYIAAAYEAEIRRESEEAGRQKGEEIGRLEVKKKIAQKMKLQGLSDAAIAEMLEVTVEMIQQWDNL